QSRARRVVGIKIDADLQPVLDRSSDLPRRCDRLHCGPRAHTGQLLQPLGRSVEHLQDGAVAGLFQRPEAKTPVRRSLPQPSDGNGGYLSPYHLLAKSPEGTLNIIAEPGVVPNYKLDRLPQALSVTQRLAR